MGRTDERSWQGGNTTGVPRENSARSAVFRVKACDVPPQLLAGEQPGMVRPIYTQGFSLASAWHAPCRVIHPDQGTVHVQVAPACPHAPAGATLVR